jgi:hypothetical protein
VAKDPDDLDTLEIPFLEKPLQALMNVMRERKRTQYEIEAFIQKLERVGRQTGDLEMLIGVRDWRRREALLAQADGRHHGQSAR